MCGKKLKLLLGYRESCAMLVLCGVIVVERASNVKSVFTFKWWFSVVAIKVWLLMWRVLSHTCNECYSAPCNVSSPLLSARRKLFVTCNVYLLSAEWWKHIFIFLCGTFHFRSHLCLTILNRYFCIQFTHCDFSGSGCYWREVCTVSQCVFIPMCAWLLADASVDVAFILLTF